MRHITRMGLYGGRMHVWGCDMWWFGFGGVRLVVLFFFFQAEDGIRDLYVTGVQTCALPIWRWRRGRRAACRTILPRGSPPPPATAPSTVSGGRRTSRRRPRRSGNSRHWKRASRRGGRRTLTRSEEHTSELQSRRDLVCRLLL